MDISISLQSLKNSVRFPFRDAKWQGKFVIGSALGFASVAMIPFLPGLPLLGYASRVIRAGAANDRPNKLPDWDNWSELCIDGLRLFATLAIGMLPATLVFMTGWFIYLGVSIWFPIMMENAEPNSTTLPIIIFILALLFFLITLGVSTLLSVGAAIILPPAMTHVAVTRKFTSLFRLDEWWRILRANLLGFIISLGALGALYFLLAVIVQIMCFTFVFCLFIPLVAIPIGFYGMLIYSRMIGQAYGEVSGIITKVL